MALVQSNFSGIYTNIGTSGTRYNRAMAHGGTWASTISTRKQVVPTAGKIKNLRLHADVACGSGASRTIQLVKNGTITGTGAVLSGASDVDAVNDSEEITFAAGDTIEIAVTASAAPAPANQVIFWAWDWVPTTDQESVLMAGSIGNVDNASTRYASIGPSNQNEWTTIESTRRVIVPTDGTFSDFHVVLDTAPGAGTSRTFTLMKNGVATSLSLTISDTNTSGSDTSNSVSVTSGDEFTIRATVSGTPALSVAQHGLVFVSDTIDESLHLGRGTGAISGAGGTQYNNLGAASSVWSATETFFEALVGEITTLHKLIVRLDGAPAFAGSSYTFSPEANSTAGVLEVVISDSDTEGSDFSSQLVLASLDILTMRVDPSSSPTPANRSAYWGLVQVNGTIAANNGGVSVRAAGRRRR